MFTRWGRVVYGEGEMIVCDICKKEELPTQDTSFCIGGYSYPEMFITCKDCYYRVYNYILRLMGEDEIPLEER